MRRLRGGRGLRWRLRGRGWRLRGRGWRLRGRGGGSVVVWWLRGLAAAPWSWAAAPWSWVAAPWWLVGLRRRWWRLVVGGGEVGVGDGEGPGDGAGEGSGPGPGPGGGLLGRLRGQRKRRQRPLLPRKAEPLRAALPTATASLGGFTVSKRLWVQCYVWLAALVDLDGEGPSQRSRDTPSSHREQASQRHRAKKDDARRDAKRSGPNLHQPRTHVGCPETDRPAGSPGTHGGSCHVGCPETDRPAGSPGTHASGCHVGCPRPMPGARIVPARENAPNASKGRRSVGSPAGPYPNADRSPIVAQHRREHPGPPSPRCGRSTTRSGRGL